MIGWVMDSMVVLASTATTPMSPLQRPVGRSPRRYSRRPRFRRALPPRRSNRLALSEARSSPALARAQAAELDILLLALSCRPASATPAGADKQPGQCARGRRGGLRRPRPNGRTAPLEQTPRIAAADTCPRALKLTDGVYPTKAWRATSIASTEPARARPAGYFSAVKTLRDAIFVPRHGEAPQRRPRL